MRTPTLPLLFATALVLGCRGEREDGRARRALETVRDDAVLFEIAREYAAWGRVDDNVRWAPEACRLDPGAGRISRSTGAHAGKLYYLYARDRAAYVDPERGEAPVGQTIVKEAFEPVALGPDEPQGAPGLDAGGRPLAERAGVRYRAGRPTGLFVLHKQGPTGDAADTDAGWIYATLEVGAGPGGAPRILSAGRVAECMACHARGTVDRQFGLAER